MRVKKAWKWSSAAATWRMKMTLQQTVTVMESRRQQQQVRHCADVVLLAL